MPNAYLILMSNTTLTAGHVEVAGNNDQTIIIGLQELAKEYRASRWLDNALGNVSGLQAFDLWCHMGYHTPFET
jgi:hypothetical protein